MFQRNSEEHQPVATGDTDSRDGDFDEHDNVLTAEDLSLDRIKTKKRGFIVGTAKSRKKKIGIVCGIFLLVVVLLGVIIGVLVNKSGSSNKEPTSNATVHHSKGAHLDANAVTPNPIPNKGAATAQESNSSSSHSNSSNAGHPSVDAHTSSDSSSGLTDDAESIKLDLIEVDKLPPYDMKPVMYTLEITLEEDSFLPDDTEAKTGFKGHVDTLLFMTQKTNNITFHAQHIRIANAVVYTPDLQSETYQYLQKAGVQSGILQLLNDVKVDPKTGFQYNLELPDYNSDVYHHLTKELLKYGHAHKVPQQHVYLDDKHGLAMLHFDGQGIGGEGQFIVLSIEYDGKIHSEEDHAGLYRVVYEQGIGGTNVAIPGDFDFGPEVMLLTNLDQGRARRFFPCFDVPHMRAMFSFTVNLPTELDLLVLGNTREDQRDDDIDSGMTKVTFQTSPPMPAYLLGLVVGDFDSAEVDGDYDVANLVDVYGRPAVLDQLEVPMVLVYEALQFFQDYTSVEQPDAFDFHVVAVPRKPYPNEAWGILTLDEERFLLQPITASSRDIYRTIALICHEIGLQWFGNLVGMQTYADSSWIHGLTTHLQYKCIESLSDGMLPEMVMVQMSPSPLLETGGLYDGVLDKAVEAGASPYTAPVKYDISLLQMVEVEMKSVYGGQTIQHEVPLDHVLLATWDEATIALSGAFFGFLEGLTDGWYGIPFDQMLQNIVKKRSLTALSFEQLIQDVVDYISEVHGEQKMEWTQDEKNNLFSALMTWVYTPGYPAVFLAPRTVDEDENDQVWDINVAINQNRFCIQGVISSDNSDEIGCFDQSPEELETTLGITVPAVEYNLRSIVMNVQYLYGGAQDMFELLRERAVDTDAPGWIQLQRASDEQQIQQEPVSEDVLAQNGYIFIERKAAMAPLHLTLYPRDEYLNLADFFQDVLSGLDSVLEYEEHEEEEDRGELSENDSDSTQEDLGYAIGNKREVANVLMDIYMIGRDVMKAAMSPITYGSDDGCYSGDEDQCFYPQIEVLELFNMFTMFRGSKHGVLQYSMGKIATELMERYSGAIMSVNPSCHQEFESILLPLFSLMADDMTQQLVDNGRLGITDQVYDWNRVKDDDYVSETPEVTDMIIDEDSFYKKLFLGELMTIANLYNDMGMIESFADTLYTAFLENKNVIEDGMNEARYSYWLHELVHPDLQAIVYMCALRDVDQCRIMLNFRGGSTPFNKLFSNALTQGDKNIRHRIIQSLATTPDPEKAEQLVQFVFGMSSNPLASYLADGQNPPPFLPEKQVDVLLMTVRNPSTRDVMLEFISKNLDELESVLDEKRFVNMMVKVFKYATPSKEVYESLKEEIGKMSISDFGKDQIISKLNSVVFWILEHEERVCEWVSERMSSIGIGDMKMHDDSTDFSMSTMSPLSKTNFGISSEDPGDPYSEDYEEKDTSSRGL